MTYIPPGGWCLNVEENAAGIATAGLLWGNPIISAYIGGVLTEVLKGQGISAQQIQQALDNAYAASAQRWDNYTFEYGEPFMAALVPSALLIQQTKDVLYHAVAALQRLGAKINAVVPAPGFPSLQDQIFDNLAIEQQDLQKALAFTEDTAILQQQDYNAKFASAFADIAQTGNEVRQFALDHDAAVAEAAATALLNDARAIETWVQQVAAELQQHTDTLNNQVIADLQAVEAWAQQAIALAESYAQQAADQAEQNATDAQAKAVTQTLAPVWAGTADSVNQSATQLLVDHPEESQQLQGIDTSVPVDAATALLGLTTAVKTLAKTATDCTLPNCNIKNNVAKQLKDLFGLVAGGGLLAAIVYMAEHPDAASHDAHVILHGVGEGIVTAVKDVVRL